MKNETMNWLLPIGATVLMLIWMLALIAIGSAS